MNFYFGIIDLENRTWGFLEESDDRVWEDAEHTQLKSSMIFVTEEELQNLLVEQAKGKQIVGYKGECFAAEMGRYYVKRDGLWYIRPDKDFKQEKADRKRKELINILYEIKAKKAYGGITINNNLVFETNQTAITNTVASLALMSDSAVANWKFYTTTGVPIVQNVTKVQLAGIAQFAQGMINQCFAVEGTYNTQLQAAIVNNLLDDNWVENFIAEAQTAMDAISNNINVSFS